MKLLIQVILNKISGCETDVDDHDATLGTLIDIVYKHRTYLNLTKNEAVILLYQSNVS